MRSFGAGRSTRFSSRESQTNVCCESTARDAMMMSYRVIVLSDGCGCRSDREHNASLSSLMNMFADIRTCDSVINLLQHRTHKELEP